MSNYSISSGPDSRAYRISVKREARPVTPPGIVSNWLHDQASPDTVLKVAPPAGEFFLDEKDDGPVVLLSGGVGLTPMMSMLEVIVASGSGRPTWYVHGAENGRWAHSFFVSFANTIAGGSSEIQRNIIATRILGLPR